MFSSRPNVQSRALQSCIGSYSGPMGVLVIAGLMAATTTFGRYRYIIGYLMFEAVFLISQHIRAYHLGPQTTDQPQTSTPRVGLWKDILAALDDMGSVGVDKWLSKVFGVKMVHVTRENIEELLAESIFNSSLSLLRADPLKYHALNQTVTELEIRRNSRFTSGCNKNISPLLPLAHSTSRQTPVRSLLEVISQLVFGFAIHSLLLLVGFRSLPHPQTPLVLSYKCQKASDGPDKVGSPVIFCLGDSWSKWRMIPTVMRLRRSGDHLLYILNSSRHDLAADSEVSLNDILWPEDRTRDPILLVTRDTLASAAKLIKGSRNASIVLVDPSIHPLLSTALDPSITPLAQDAGNDPRDIDISTLGSSGQIAQVILTPSMSTETSLAIKRYCELKSIPISSISSTSLLDTGALSLSETVIDTCHRITKEQASSPIVSQPNTPEYEITTPEDSPAGIPLVTLLSGTGPTTMSTLENISSIGMCIAPPLRTRQRSQSLGTVVGYGHVDGMRRPSTVVAM